MAGVPKKRIAARVGPDPKTVRRYVQVGEAHGIGVEAGPGSLTDERLGAVVAQLMQLPGRPLGQNWDRCQAERALIEQKLEVGVKLTKVRKLLRRQGVTIPCSTLHRFATQELRFGRKAPTVPVADGAPGQELQLDTGWLTSAADVGGFGCSLYASLSRYRFVYLCIGETTASTIEACEAAWDFYGGVFGVLIVDNTKASSTRSTRSEFGSSTTSSRMRKRAASSWTAACTCKPTDKARLERWIRYVRDDCFAGEDFRDLGHARERALEWSRHEAGVRRHSRTLQVPKE